MARRTAVISKAATRIALSGALKRSSANGRFLISDGQKRAIVEGTRPARPAKNA